MLLSSSGLLKLADFGLAKHYADPTIPMTSTVMTLYAAGGCPPGRPPRLA